LSSFLLLSPLLEPSLLFFLLSVRSLLGAVAVTPPKKKKKIVQGSCSVLHDALNSNWAIGCCSVSIASGSIGSAFLIRV